ncbi:MAG TPA: hypothetical protein VFD07_08690 [Candidatus Krumholzibacteria bacterium]|nr:hypothetical protein [Candidatus Krumholzibacteria bacterium]
MHDLLCSAAVQRRAILNPVVLVAVLPVAAGLVETLRRAWVCDDAFISFRYVDHLLRGHGLVFNPGERVEGYTHFLWVILLAACNRLGFDLVELGRYLPILFFVATLFVLAQRAWRLRAGAWMGLPIAAWCLALHHDAQLFASSGLETAPFGLLLVLGLLAATATTPRVGLAGALYALATLMRPEGALYTATAGAFLLWRARAVRPIAAFSATWMALVAPCLVFRWIYYGDLLPNSFYAKSGADSYWSQGWQYTRLYFGIYFVLLAALAAIPASWVLRRRRHELDTALLAGIQVLLTILYVTRLGGDFMFARFFIPMTPLLVLAAEDVLRVSRRRWVEITAAVLMVGSTLAARPLRSRTFVGRERVHGIVDEANYYTAETLAMMRRQGDVLGRHLNGTRARVALLPGQDAVAYFGRLPYALESQGLTDAELARLPLATRGRPGHERGITLEQLLARHIHFRLRYGLTTNLPQYKQIRFDDLYGEMIHYDRELMQEIARRPGINFIPFARHVQDFLQNLSTIPPRRVVDDYYQFHIFYFGHNDDPALLARLRTALIAAGIPEAHLAQAERLAAQTLQAAGLAPTTSAPTP